MTDSARIDPNVIVDATGCARDGHPSDTWARLRRESPVHWCEPDITRPFWAVTRHAESSHPETFRSASRLTRGAR
ncbi:MAG: cytochrome P450, partial [Solirubrobacterales bacterium]